MTEPYTWHDSWSRCSPYTRHWSFIVTCLEVIHRVTCRIHMWHDSFINVTWLRVTVQLTYASLIIHSDILWSYSPFHMSQSYVTWFIHTFDVTQGHSSAHIRDIDHYSDIPWSYSPCNMPHSYVTWLIHTRDIVSEFLPPTVCGKSTERESMRVYPCLYACVRVFVLPRRRPGTLTPGRTPGNLPHSETLISDSLRLDVSLIDVWKLLVFAV